MPKLLRNSKSNKKNQTAIELTNVSNIRDNILYSKDGFHFSYLKIEPVRLDTLSSQEKYNLLNNLVSSLSFIDFPFKIIQLLKPISIDKIKEDYYQRFVNSKDRIIKRLLENAMQNLSSQIMEGEVLENQYYFVIWDKEIDVLIRKSNELKSKLFAGNFKSIICNENEIIEICSLFANPEIDRSKTVDIGGSIIEEYKERRAYEES